MFEKLGWFNKNRFDLIRDDLTIGHGSGPQRFGVKLKMPEAAAFFILVNGSNRDNAIDEVKRLLC